MILKYLGRGRPEPTKRDDRGRYKGDSRVICTHFFKTGQMDKHTWLLDIQYTFEKNFPCHN